MSEPDLLLGPLGSQWMDTLTATNKTHASEIKRLRELNAELVAALEHILAGSLSLPRFAEQEARAAIAKAEEQA